MKKKLINIALLMAISVGTTQAQTIDDIFNILFGNQGKTSQTTQSGLPQQNQQNQGFGLGLNNLDISNGLKEALSIGAQNASSRLSVTAGFFRNAAVKILMPPEVQQVERTLRQFGLGSVADQAILTMNRAAEDAAKKAAPIFINAITKMTLNDALSILRGGNNSATNYLQRMTQQELMNAFAPVVSQSLSKVGADRIWNTVFSTYNSLPLSGQKINTDLTQYVTQRATQGMFTMIAEEELKIRQNPVARTTDLLRKVFGR